jgi:hypothetical protein
MLSPFFIFPEINVMQKGHAALSHFGGSFINTIMDAYPDLGWKKDNFNIVESMHAYKIKFITGNFWNNITNRKAFFDNFARKSHFEPLNPDNWYTKSYKDFEHEKVQ